MFSLTHTSCHCVEQFKGLPVTLKRKTWLLTGCSIFGAAVATKQRENTRGLQFDFQTVLNKLLLVAGTEEPKDTPPGGCGCWLSSYFSLSG